MSEWAAWKCPWCGWSNNRDHEGLDECEKCGSEAATAYQTDSSLAVKWAREPRTSRDGDGETGR